jgi:hypothetical protein
MLYNYLGWHKNIRVMLTFGLAFILCFLLSDKAVGFAQEYGTSMQIVEAFVWTFGDSNSILLTSTLLLLLFADMPQLSPATPFYLMRINRKTWMIGQATYIISATFLYLIFILTATALVCMTQSFIGNVWSETAAILGYSNAGQRVALPALVKTLESSTPYACMGTIFLLMLLYTFLMVLIMLFFNIWKGQLAGVISVLTFDVFGFLLNPQTLKVLFQLPDERLYQANVAVGWISPLNHATYHMHNFGYDLLPRLWQTYTIFSGLIITIFLLSLWAIRRYNFHFTGTEGS